MENNPYKLVAGKIREVLGKYDELLEMGADPAATNSQIHSSLLQIYRNCKDQGDEFSWVGADFVQETLQEALTNSQKGVVACEILALMLHFSIVLEIRDDYIQEIIQVAVTSLENQLSTIETSTWYIPICLKIYRILLFQEIIQYNQDQWKAFVNSCLGGDSSFASKNAIDSEIELGKCLTPSVDQKKKTDTFLGSSSPNKIIVEKVTTRWKTYAETISQNYQNNEGSNRLTGRLLSVFYKLLVQVSLGSVPKMAAEVVDDMLNDLGNQSIREDFEHMELLLKNVFLCSLLFPSKIFEDFLTSISTTSNLSSCFYWASFCVYDCDMETTGSFKQNLYVQILPIFELLTSLSALPQKPNAEDLMMRRLVARCSNKMKNCKEKFTDFSCFDMKFTTDEGFVQSKRENICCKIFNKFTSCISRSTTRTEDFELLFIMGTVLLRMCNTTPQLFRNKQRLCESILNMLQMLGLRLENLVEECKHLRVSLLQYLNPLSFSEYRLKVKAIKVLQNLQNIESHELRLDIISIVYPKMSFYLCDVNWEVRDSAFEYLTATIQSSTINSTFDVTILSESNLIADILNGIEDEEQFVCCSAIKCLSALCSNQSFGTLCDLSMENIFLNFISGIETSGDRTIRLYCLQSLEEIFSEQFHSNSKIRDYFLKFLSSWITDFDIEMCVRALRILTKILNEQFQSQQGEMLENNKSDPLPHVSLEWAQDCGIIGAILEAVESPVHEMREQASSAIVLLNKLYQMDNSFHTSSVDMKTDAPSQDLVTNPEPETSESDMEVVLDTSDITALNRIRKISTNSDERFRFRKDLSVDSLKPPQCKQISLEQSKKIIEEVTEKQAVSDQGKNLWALDNILIYCSPGHAENAELWAKDCY